MRIVEEPLQVCARGGAINPFGVDKPDREIAGIEQRVRDNYFNAAGQREVGMAAIVDLFEDFL